MTVRVLAGLLAIIPSFSPSILMTSFPLFPPAASDLKASSAWSRLKILSPTWRVKCQFLLVRELQAAGLYRVYLAVRDEFSEVIQDVTIQPGIFPVLTINI